MPKAFVFDRIKQQQQTKTIYTFYIPKSPSNVRVHRVTAQNKLGRVTRDSVLLGKITTRQQSPMVAKTNKRKQTDKIGISV